MKYILILICAISVSNANAQYQSIFGSESTTWKLFYTNPFSEKRGAEIVADTLVLYDGKQWHALSWNGTGMSPSYTLFLREELDSGKSFVLFDTTSSSSEALFMDLSLNVGETFSNGGTFFNRPRVGSVVDSVFWDDLGRKHIRFNEIMIENYNQKFEFIEGVGSSSGIRNLVSTSGISEYTLVCHFKNDTLSYSNPSPFVENCVPSFLSVNSLESSSIHVYPNPVVGTFVISGLATGILTNLELIDLQGKIVRVFDPSQQSFSVEEIQSGFYLLKMKTDSEARCVRIEIIN